MPTNPGGVFAVSRGIFDHPAFAKEAFTEREAWLFLISAAAWRPTTIRVGAVLVDLVRGQCAYSVRFLAERWGWSKSRVDRFLGRLKIGTMIGTAAGQGVTVITICNYDEYQKVGKPKRDSSRDTGRDSSGTAAGQIRNTETLKEEEIIPATDVAGSPKQASKNKQKTYPAEFDAVWTAYPTSRNMSKAEGFAAWSKLDEEDRGLVAKSIPSFVAYCRANPDYPVIYFDRYVSKRRFDGHAEAGGGAITVADWSRRLEFGRSKRQWATSEWGPMPGLTGSLVPKDIVRPDDGVGWTEWKQHAAA